MARRNGSEGISPGGKLAIILVVFGIPILFFAASWGLDQLFQMAPWVGIAVILLIATAYTAHTSSLLHRYYDVDPPVLRFIPCLCELSLIDRKYRGLGFIMYALAGVMACGALMPYSVASILGESFVEWHTWWFGVACLLCLAVLQVVKGIGISGCMNDIAEDWYQQVHVDIGLIKRFVPLGFIPFVRVVALYSLNKPLDTMVTFVGVNVNDVGAEDEFYEE